MRGVQRESSFHSVRGDRERELGKDGVLNGVYCITALRALAVLAALMLLYFALRGEGLPEQPQ